VDNLFLTIPLTDQFAEELAEQIRTAFSELFSLPNLLPTEKAQWLMPLYANEVISHLEEGTRALSLLSIGSSLVRSILGEYPIVDKITDLRFWKTIVKQPQLLLELLAGVTDYITSHQSASAAHRASKDQNVYFEYIQRLPQTRIARLIVLSTLIDESLSTLLDSKVDYPE
jgi:hypothetical protein